MQRLCRACQDWHDLEHPWPLACVSHFRGTGPRSDLAFPMIVSDSMDAVQSMADGKFYDSKAKLRADYKARGLVEVGSDIPAAMKHAEIRPERPKLTKAEIGAAVAQVKAGYKPALPVD